MFESIQTADLEWKCIDGIEIPYAKQFGDIYFSQDNGLLESRHVFINGNDLSTRLAQLSDYAYFQVGETGFGTGLNILALWQLWQQVRPKNHSKLHVTTVEKFPLSKSDLIRALKVWPELEPLAEQLTQQYPLPIAGCHRLSFAQERFSIDLWLGDAHDVFPVIPKTSTVDAWFLDGFAPSCNPEMWEEQILKNIVRLSKIGTTFTSFSVAGVLKRGLSTQGIQISRPRGFLHKRQMLKGVWALAEADPSISATSVSASTPNTIEDTQISPVHELLEKKQRQIAIIGAGVAGLSCAYAFAQRGHLVTIYDRFEPLSGASGNPLALLNPKLSPIEQSAEHLMTLSWQHALTHYAHFRAFRPITVNQLAVKNSDELLALSQQYPEQLLQAQSSSALEIKTAFPSLALTVAGSISPHLLRDQIIEHPLIEFKQASVDKIEQNRTHAGDLNLNNLSVKDLGQNILGTFDHVVVCCANASNKLFESLPELKPIRGQVSWVNNHHVPLNMQHAYSYGGYCMQLNQQELILGASFYPNRDDSDVLIEDHQHNLELIQSVFPDYANKLPEIEHWQGRASVRAQSLDYFPLLGKIKDNEEIYTFSGLGSKGFLFAPLCSEILVAMVLEEACPIPHNLLQKLNVKRFKKKIKVKKPYFKVGSQNRI